MFDRCRDSRDRHTREDSRDERRRPYSDRRYDDDRRKLDDDRRVLDEERRRFDSDKRKYNDRDDRNFTRREEPRDRYRARKDSRSGSRELEHGSKPKIMKTGDNAEKPVQGVPLNLIMIDDILKSPGREMRPDKIVIILRGKYCYVFYLCANKSFPPYITSLYKHFLKIKFELCLKISISKYTG